MLMKKSLILIILSVLITTGCYAQNKYPQGISKIKGEQFRISNSGLENDLIVVCNLKNKYALGGPNPENPNAPEYKREDIHFDVPAAKAIIHMVLQGKKEKLQQNEDFVHVDLIFKRSGKLSDVAYAVKKNTLITLADIAEIDAQLRNTLRATFTGNAYKEHRIFNYDFGSVRF